MLLSSHADLLAAMELFSLIPPYSIFITTINQTAFQSSPPLTFSRCIESRLKRTTAALTLCTTEHHTFPRCN